MRGGSTMPVLVRRVVTCLLKTFAIIYFRRERVPLAQAAPPGVPANPEIPYLVIGRVDEGIPGRSANPGSENARVRTQREYVLVYRRWEHRVRKLFRMSARPTLIAFSSRSFSPRHSVPENRTPHPAPLAG